MMGFHFKSLSRFKLLLLAPIFFIESCSPARKVMKAPHQRGRCRIPFRQTEGERTEIYLVLSKIFCGIFQQGKRELLQRTDPNPEGQPYLDLPYPDAGDRGSAADDLPGFG
jgi:hypothetical protein